MSFPTQIKTPRRTYECEKRVSIAPWLHAPLPPTLVFSDTHLVPSRTAWSDDAPEDLHALIETLSAHRLLSLGDLTESVGLRALERAQLFTCERLTALWSVMRARDFHLLIGNHDVSGEELIRAYFGEGAVLNGEMDRQRFCPGLIRLRHGHEKEQVMTKLMRHIGPLAVPIYERISQRLRPSAERLSNARVLQTLRDDAEFVLFGHTHSRGIDIEDPHRAWANPGCFLGSAQSFITLEENEMALYVMRA